MIFTPSFYPSYLLNNAHIQTIAASWFVKVPEISYKRERIVTPDKDFFDVDWSYPVVECESAPVVVLQHGLEGSSNSPYIKRLASYFVANGYIVAAVNFRGCSGAINKQAYSYHAGFYRDLKQLIERESIARPASKISIVGISLGGACALAVAENIDHSLLHKICLISVPFDLSAGLVNIEHGSNRIYNSYFTSQLKKSYRAKYQQVKDRDKFPLTSIEVKKIGNLREFDNEVTAPVSGYTTGEQYYQLNRPLSRIDRLRALTDRIGIFIAKDDPLLHSSALTELKFLCKNDFSLWLSEKGGHAGFVEWRSRGSAEQWLIPKVFDWINDE